MQRFPAGNALALADDEGRNSVWLACQGLIDDAFDFPPPAKARARALTAKYRVEVDFACSDWQSFDWKPEQYDLGAGIFFQFATPDERSDLFKQIERWLKPGGLLIIQGYGKNQLSFKTGGSGKLEHLYDDALLRQAFAGFDIQVCKTCETTNEEGSGHHGTSALVGFVARKP